MPITFVSGTPGAGKTLNTIKFIIDDYADRPIFYMGINLTEKGAEQLSNWKEIDDKALTDWQGFPAGALIVVDESQYQIPARKRNDDVPPWIGELSTHRHHGIDFIFISQHPHLIDTYVRKLVDRHQHYHRSMGLERVTRYTWEHLADPTRDQKKGNRETIKYPTEIYELYKSAEAHTVKRKIPKKMKWGLILPLIFLCAIGYLIFMLYTKFGASPVKEKENPLDKALDTKTSYVKKTTNYHPWFFENKPRVYKTSNGLYHVYTSTQKEEGTASSETEFSEEYIVLNSIELRNIGYKIFNISSCIDLIVQTDLRIYTSCVPVNEEKAITELVARLNPPQEYQTEQNNPEITLDPNQ